MQTEHSSPEKEFLKSQLFHLEPRFFQEGVLDGIEFTSAQAPDPVFLFEIKYKQLQRTSDLNLDDVLALSQTTSLAEFSSQPDFSELAIAIGMHCLTTPQTKDFIDEIPEEELDAMFENTKLKTQSYDIKKKFAEIMYDYTLDFRAETHNQNQASFFTVQNQLSYRSNASELKASLKSLYTHINAQTPGLTSQNHLALQLLGRNIAMGLCAKSYPPDIGLLYRGELNRDHLTEAQNTFLPGNTSFSIQQAVASHFSTQIGEQTGSHRLYKLSPIDAPMFSPPSCFANEQEMLPQPGQIFKQYPLNSNSNVQIIFARKENSPAALAHALKHSESLEEVLCHWENASSQEKEDPVVKQAFINEAIAFPELLEQLAFKDLAPDSPETFPEEDAFNDLNDLRTTIQQIQTSTSLEDLLTQLNAHVTPQNLALYAHSIFESECLNGLQRSLTSFDSSQKQYLLKEIITQTQGKSLDSSKFIRTIQNQIDRLSNPSQPLELDHDKIRNIVRLAVSKSQSWRSFFGF